jgi:YidC/Oxa1 family membrane protein insertase
MSMFAAFGAVVGVAHSAIESLSTVLTPVAGSLAGALAIVLFTLAVRLLISPLTYLQVRAERRRTALAPQIEKLRRKHRDDPVALATETIALQRAAGAGPFVSLLPGLAQAPFFMIMFRLVRPGAAVVTGLLAGSMFGVPLTAHLIAGLPVFVVLLALAVLLGWWSSRRMRRTATGDVAGVGAGIGAGVGRILPLLPYLTVFVIAYLPLAGALYLVTSTAWTALEHAVWRRPGIATNR